MGGYTLHLLYGLLWIAGCLGFLGILSVLMLLPDYLEERSNH